MKNKFLLLSLLLLVFLSNTSSLTAQETNTSDSEKLDSILVLQKKMNQRIDKNPLKDKKFGLELNLFRLLFIDDAFTFSGGVSLFDVNRHAEIAFPIYFQIPKDDFDLRIVTIDGHYRYFLGERQGGFFVSGFSRLAYLNGFKQDSYDFNDNGSLSGEKDTIFKLGLGIGIGYRIFSYRGIYWGTSLNVGRYIIGKNDHFYSNFLDVNDDGSTIVDFEFLKFGWAF